MTKTQLLEHSLVSELDHEHCQLSGVSRVCELGVFGCGVGCIAASGCAAAVAVELFCRVAPRVLAWKINRFQFLSDILDIIWKEPSFFYQEEEALPFFLLLFSDIFFFVWTDPKTGDNGRPKL